MPVSVDFGSVISEWCKQTEARILALRNNSVQRIAEEMNTPRGNGGFIPVDTGYMRSTLGAYVGGESVSVTYHPDPTRTKRFNWESSPVALAINRAKINEDITLLYTANYAVYQEAKVGWVRLAAQRWPTIVTEECMKLEAGK